ncbi:MAG: hypothetical protein OEZ59_04565 [Deltaproteobacteria bacterium]|nr:hypothetical protein [Deltaproteobacteria bacterium]
MDWRKTVREIAPVIGSALFGPAGGAAARVLGEQLLGKPDASEAELAAAVRDMSPGELARMEQLQGEFSLRMRELGIDAERLRLESERTAAADRAQARQRQIVLGDRTPQVLAYLFCGGFFVVLGLQLVLLFRQGLQVNPEVLRLVDVSTGVMFAVVLASKDYFLGSSAGSRRKTEILEYRTPA